MIFCIYILFYTKRFKKMAIRCSNMENVLKYFQRLKSYLKISQLF